MLVDLIGFALETAQESVPGELSKPMLTLLPGHGSPQRGWRICAGTLLDDSVLNESGRFLNDLIKTVSQGEGQQQVFTLSRQFFEALSKEKPGLDLDEDETAKKQVAYVTGVLSKASLAMAQLYRSKWDEMNVTKQALMDMRDVVFAQIGKDEQRAQQYLAKCKAIEERCRQMERDMDGHLQEVLQARKKLDEIQEKVKAAKKWCWVIGYGLYLYIEAENALSHWNECQDMLRNAQERLDEARDEEARIKCEFSGFEQLEKKAREHVAENEQKLNKCIKNISTAKTCSLQYSDFSTFFGSAYAQMQYTGTDVKTASKLLVEIKEFFARFPDIGEDVKFEELHIGGVFQYPVPGIMGKDTVPFFPNKT